MCTAIILAGGFGTRLREVSGNVPKPMMPVNGDPFLYFLMRWLEGQGCDRIILSLHYRAQFIIDRILMDQPVSCRVEFSVEEEPLGTGGAVKDIVSRFDLDECFFVLNGDSFVSVSLSQMLDAFQNKTCIACIAVDDTSRYGSVLINAEGQIIGFGEKALSGAGLINAGVYLLTRDDLSSVPQKVFSLEKDLFQARIGQLDAFLTEGVFIDIGIVEDYKKAGPLINAYLISRS